MERDQWIGRARQVLEGVVQWWMADAPERKLTPDGAHDLGNLILHAQDLLAHLPEEEDEGHPD